MSVRDTTMAEAAVTPCEACPNGGARAVATRGPVPARLLFLSGAPRLHEEQRSYAFASPALPWLEQTLAEVGLNPASVHFATLIGCRPPYQRPMRAEEIAACAPRLERTIAAVAPEVIVLCGPDAVDALLPGVALGATHGQIVTHDGRRYLPLRHPYAALHNERYMAEVVADLTQLAAQLATSLPDLPRMALEPDMQTGAITAVQTEEAEPVGAPRATAIVTAAHGADALVALNQAEAEMEAAKTAPDLLHTSAEPTKEEQIEPAQADQDGAERAAAALAETTAATEPEAITTEQDGPAQLSLF